MYNPSQNTGKKFNFTNRFLTGLTIALAFTLTAFEWTTVSIHEIDRENPDITYYDDEELPPITYTPEKPAKPLPPKPHPSPTPVIDLSKPKPDPIPTPPIDDKGIDNNDLLDKFDPTLYGHGDDHNYDKIEDKIYDFFSIQVFAHYDNCSNLSGDALRDCSQLEIVKRIKKNFRISEQLKDAGGKQIAQIGFIIDKEGNIHSVEVIASTSKAMGRDAVKAIKKLPKMNPAQQQGRNVALQLKIPITVEIL